MALYLERANEIDKDSNHYNLSVEKKVVLSENGLLIIIQIKKKR